MSEGAVAELSSGLFHDLAFDEYRAIEALSASGAKKIIDQSMLHWLLERNAPSEPTQAMRIGTALHTAVLEPDVFSKTYLALPDDAPQKPTVRQELAKKPSEETIAALKWWREFGVVAHGKTILERNDHINVRGAASAVGKHPAASRLLKSGFPEVSALWRDSEFDIDCKSRFDYLRKDSGIVDLKTTRNAAPDAFGRQAATLMYHVQAAMYCRAHEQIVGEPPQFFVFIAVEVEPPYGVGVYLADPVQIRAGEHLLLGAMAAYARAVRTGQYVGYPDTIEQLRLPAWALKFNS